MAERIQKILSQWGVASRRQAEKMILAGRVKINDRIAVLGDKADLSCDLLEVDGRRIKSDRRPQQVYLLVNKPLRVVSTCADPKKRKTVLDLLPPHLRKGWGIHPVGRLDFNSTGALILTNDGAFTLNLTHPRYHLAKTYLVCLNGCPMKQDLELWRKGVMLDGNLTLPAEVEIIEQKQDRTLLKIVLTEGRNRQIRRIAEKLGFRVTSLHRTAIANLTLNHESGKNLAPGEYRHLTKNEVTSLQQNLKQKSLDAPAFRNTKIPK